MGGGKAAGGDSRGTALGEGTSHCGGGREGDGRRGGGPRGGGGGRGGQRGGRGPLRPYPVRARPLVSPWSPAHAQRAAPPPPWRSRAEVGREAPPRAAILGRPRRERRRAPPSWSRARETLPAAISGGGAILHGEARGFRSAPSWKRAALPLCPPLSPQPRVAALRRTGPPFHAPHPIPTTPAGGAPRGTPSPLLPEAAPRAAMLCEGGLSQKPHFIAAVPTSATPKPLNPEPHTPKPPSPPHTLRPPVPTQHSVLSRGALSPLFGARSAILAQAAALWGGHAAVGPQQPRPHRGLLEGQRLWGGVGGRAGHLPSAIGLNPAHRWPLGSGIHHGGVEGDAAAVLPICPPPLCRGGVGLKGGGDDGKLRLWGHDRDGAGLLHPHGAGRQAHRGTAVTA